MRRGIRAVSNPEPNRGAPDKWFNWPPSRGSVAFAWKVKRLRYGAQDRVTLLPDAEVAKLLPESLSLAHYCAGWPRYFHSSR